MTEDRRQSLIRCECKGMTCNHQNYDLCDYDLLDLATINDGTVIFPELWLELRIGSLDQFVILAKYF